MATSKQNKSDTVADTNIPSVNNTNKSPTPKNNIDNDNNDVGTPPHQNNKAANKSNPLEHCVTDTIEAMLSPSKLNINDKSELDGSDEKEVPTPPSSNKSINSQTKTTIIGSGSKSRRSTRSRTRSLSSAVSSLSGAEDINVDDTTTAVPQQPDGNKDKGRDEGRDNKKSPPKTPLIKNTKGPVRKRHKGGAKKSLFNNNDADGVNNSEKEKGDHKTVAADSKEDKAAVEKKGEEDNDTPPIGSKKPPPDDDMSQLINAPTTEAAAEAADKKEEDIDTPPFGSSKPPPLNEDIEISSTVLPPILNNPVDEPQVSFKEDEGDESNSVVGKGRARSNTIESFRAAMNSNHSNNNENDEESRVDIEMLPDINPLSPGGNSITNNSNNKRRSRSDTIDFLSSHVEFQVDNDNSTTNNVDIDTNGNMIYNPTPVGKATSDLMKGTTNETYQSQSYTHHMDIYGKTPKITNRTRGTSHASLTSSIGSNKSGSQTSLTSQGPIRKRYRTRSNSGSIATINKPERYRNNSLSINSVVGSGGGKESKKTASASTTVDMMMDNNKNDEDNGINYNEEDNEGGGRYRSNTLDNVFPGYRQRERSDTLDFLTAAVAGDMGHDLDAAVAAAADDGASFAMHVISAPSGASSNYTALRPIRAGSGGSDLLLHGNGSSRSRSGTMDSISRQQQRPRSDTLDSTASSINSTKLDFFVQVAAEQGVLNSPVPAGGGLVGSVAGIGGKDESLLAVQHQRRPRSDTLEIYSNMNNAASALSAHRTRSDTVDFLIGTNSDDPVGDIELSDVATTAGTVDVNSNVQDHLKALCEGDPLNNTDGITTTSSSNNNKINEMKTLPPKKRRSKRKLAAAGATEETSKTTEEDASTTATPSRNNKKTRKNSEATWKTNLSSSQDNSLMNSVNNRNRLESWGGMSDLSVGGMGSTSAIAATHQQLKDTGILDDVLAAAADLDNHGDDISSGASSLERLRRSSRGMSGGSSLSGAAKGRPRKNSLASLSLASLESDTLLPPDKSSSSKTSKKPAAARKKAAKKTKQKKKDVKTTSMSTTKRTKQGADAASVNTGTGSIVVDYDAIASAVTAANAALDNLDMSAIAAMAGGAPSATKSSSAGSKPAVKIQTSAGVKKTEQPKLPVKRVVIPAAATAKPTISLPPIVPQATMKKMAPSQTSLTAKAALPSLPAVNLKAAAENSSGKKVPFPVTSINVPVPTSSSTNNNTARANYTTLPTVPEVPAYPQVSSNIPIKKRFLPGVQSNNVIQSNNYYQIQRPRHTFAPKINTGTLQSQQKWDDMFQHLVQFIADTRAEKTKTMTEEKKSAWVWDGNVPTSYKTPSGKALGRWINNQRSAKAKGTLKDDREVRLVSTGLKWSVLTTNSWKQMLDELASYAKSQTKNGRSWDVSKKRSLIMLLIVLYRLFSFVTNIDRL